MRRAPAGVDLTVYVTAIPLLLRNPSIIVVPLLMGIVGVLVGMALSPSAGGAIGYASSGLGGLLVRLLQLFGLGVACIIADDAWRHGRASFERGWAEAQRRGGDLLMAGIGITLIIAVALLAGSLVGALAFGFPFAPLLLAAAALVLLVWAVPAVAVGGVPGGASIQDSIDRVRSNPATAVLTTIVCGLALYAALRGSAYLWIWTAPYLGGSLLVYRLIDTLLQAIAFGYIALIITKTYTDTAFTRRRW
ncbi:MAG TPA: hypothetical protein VGU66_18480 [Candidatus Elarobacter sp.]|nr:hypothetical protein [Candidatus Elarobacter sp.]